MIQPFQPGDLFLVQRLQRQATRLNVTQALLHHRSPFWSALTAVKPWDTAKTVTYVLRQNGHGLARAGFLQAQRRPNRSEADVLLLAPALDTRTGHPAIWQKLLAHYLSEAAQHQTQRIYADVPDQPLIETTFSQVGFRTYTRQSVWRLNAGALEGRRLRLPNAVRTQSRADGWNLMRLYDRATPHKVQVAEGAVGEGAIVPPLLEWCHGGEVQQAVLARSGELEGCVHVVAGVEGIWLQLWAEPGLSGDDRWEQLVTAGLALVAERRHRAPVYVAVKEYQGGLGSVLDGFGFAPFADHARMVRQTVQRVVEADPVRMHVLDVLPEGVATFHTLEHGRSLPPPQLLHRRGRRAP